MKRQSGVLMGVFSLPSEFGIGGLSHEACDFIENLSMMGFTAWQVLPLCPIGYNKSPYFSPCRAAGNYLFTDIRGLQEEGLLTHDEVQSFIYNGSPYTVCYEHAEWAKRQALERAYTRIGEDYKTAIAEFVHKQSKWIVDYALFMAIKESDSRPFYEWERSIKFRDKKKLRELSEKLKERIAYYYFEQYVFDRQWNKLITYANQIGVDIIGELPMYPAADSVDVWVNASDYDLDSELKATRVGGLPADYYSETGRIWGTPLYNFSRMALNGYKHIRQEIDKSVTMYNGLVLNHFRAYSEYYAIPVGEPASNGKWEKGPGMDLVSRIKRKYRKYTFIADDLCSVKDEKVEKLVARSGFYSSRVMQFAFSDARSYHLPHFYDAKVCGYTTNKDTDTTLGWLYKADESIRDYALKYCDMTDSDWGHGGASCKSTKAFIKTLIASGCQLAIVPIQDICGFGSDTRINNPSSFENNFRFRLTYSATDNLDIFFYRNMNTLYARF